MVEMCVGEVDCDKGMVRVGIVSDSDIVRSAIRGVLSHDEGISVIFSARVKEAPIENGGVIVCDAMSFGDLCKRWKHDGGQNKASIPCIVLVGPPPRNGAVIVDGVFDFVFGGAVEFAALPSVVRAAAGGGYPC
ncbi:response regulator transcription factor [Pandoraea sp. SD6-2]|uniref:response regulator transcription factor n=1 Tax=Pandoraea sp. SD6-2 TaxID=1286093 RepID=UPI001186B63B|nr:response regulator transcription factor [Pandoraea sp. SD6-2]